MSTRVLEGYILTPAGFVRGKLGISETGRIAQITGDVVAESVVRDGSRPILLPGFIDCQVNGGGGRDVMEGGDALDTIIRIHAEHGTTALLATTITAPPEDLTRAFEGIHGAMTRPVATGARVLGAHLEGPYINPDKLGAHPAFARGLDRVEFARLNALAPIRVVTLAPEVAGHLELIADLARVGHRVQLGHSLADYSVAKAALAQGAAGVTHLFNAMTGVSHREPGLATAALAHCEYSQIIPDLLHVHPGAMAVGFRAIPKLFCVTDATAATGMPDGSYHLGRQIVVKDGGAVRLVDGTLAGSTLTMHQALINLVTELDFTLADAARRVATYAADYLGLADRGRLVEGAWADVVKLDRDLRLLEVRVEGVSSEDTHG